MITYLKGDATAPQTTGNQFIVHVCNNRGGWGKGFVLAISNKWKQPEAEYRKWAKDKPTQNPFELGNIQKVQVADSLWVINMIAQDDYSPTYKVTKQYLNYFELGKCLDKVAALAKIYNASIHMPRIGCGLGGGSWSNVEKIIKASLADHPVFVYDL